MRVDPARFAVSAITTQRWSAWDDLRHYQALGVTGIGVWRQKLDGVKLGAYGRAIRNEGLVVTNLCFTGQFTLGLDDAVEDGKRALDEAAQLGAPTVLVISGPLQSENVGAAEGLLKEGLHRLADRAARLGITLAVEALHPMDMTQWTIVPTVDKALDILDDLEHPSIQLMLDLYNSWWDPGLPAAIRRAGPRVAAVQLADWRNPTRSFTDRTVPGRGVAPLRPLISAVEHTGYQGLYDLEIFSDEIWSSPEAYERTVSDAIHWWMEVEPHA